MGGVDGDNESDGVFEGFTLEEGAEAEWRRIIKGDETARVIRELESAFDSDSESDHSYRQQHHQQWLHNNHIN